MKFQFDGVMDMKIREVNENKKQFISLLLLADEQENMQMNILFCRLEQIIEYIKRNYNPISIILYGSYANLRYIINKRYYFYNQSECGIVIYKGVKKIFYSLKLQYDDN